MLRGYDPRNAFTLIELSIVLVIVGLIVGGVLVGRDLIDAAAVRSQIAQVEKLSSSTHTFQTKYNNYLPGDIPNPHATNFGLTTARGIYEGTGDGNGVIQGINSNTYNANAGFQQAIGETVVFWRDLSDAVLIDGRFTSATNNAVSAVRIPSTMLDRYFPQAKIGNGNYIYVSAFRGTTSGSGTDSSDGLNFFSISKVTAVAPTLSWEMYSDPGMTVRQAYNIDKKVDDGLPQLGKVTARYYDYNVQMYNYVWAAGGEVTGAHNGANKPTTTATPGSSTTCYDNNNGSGNQEYSITQSNGSYMNCALSFQLN